ncbi:MAG: cytochrome c oxidase assembly protein subunit 15 [Paracoccaceae bacterium]|jgi:cytochrome c oxidase assembly protein subunit 15
MSKPRAIFQETSAGALRATVPVPGAVDARRRTARRVIAAWLMALAAMVAVMVLVGGMTRLTDSGLSITEWKPVTGAVPPLSDAAWLSEFDKYRAIPEYQLQNKGMSMSEFKSIYWWEWGHRQFGRAIGLVWAVGFAFFALRRMIPPGWTGRLLLVGGLGGLQGAVGWWMVSSGLGGRMVDVASYRLATHLGLAFAILGMLLWFVWELRHDGAQLLAARRRRLGGLTGWADALMALTFVQILLGALVAGIDAGRGYTDWPLMGGEFLPSESFDYLPLWTNAFENPALVQFNHRMVGYGLAALGLLTLWRALATGHGGAKGWAGVMIALMAVQVSLGVVTVLHAAPLGLSLIHQAGALGLWAATLRLRFETRFPAEQKIARGR